MSKKQNYEHLLNRIEKLEAKIRYLLFLQDNEEDDVILCTKLADSENDIEITAKFVNSDKEVVERFVTAVPIDKFPRYEVQVKTYPNRPYTYIEVRQAGLLEAVLKVDKYLSKLHYQDLTLYLDAYGVEFNMGGKNGSKGSAKKTDA